MNDTMSVTDGASLLGLYDIMELSFASFGLLTNGYIII